MKYGAHGAPFNRGGGALEVEIVRGDYTPAWAAVEMRS